MYFECEVELLLSLLQRVFGAIERKQTMPILSHVYLEVDYETLFAVGSDLELELAAFAALPSGSTQGAVAVSARKLLDICKALPKTARISLKANKGKVAIKSDTSKFNLSTLPAEDFPRMTSQVNQVEFQMEAASFTHLLSSCYFAVAQNDVRYFLNGMLIQVDRGQVTVVGTDGHRLAKSAAVLEGLDDIERSVILPRKAVQEIVRLFDETTDKVEVALSDSHIKIATSHFEMRSRLIEGKYPDYKRVIPEKGSNIFSVDAVLLKDALSRVSVLTDDKYKGVRFQLRHGQLNLLVHNPEQEVAEELLQIDYTGDEFDIGFNAAYLLDVLNQVSHGDLKFYLSDPLGSALIQAVEMPESEFVIMPMRL